MYYIECVIIYLTCCLNSSWSNHCKISWLRSGILFPNSCIIDWAKQHRILFIRRKAMEIKASLGEWDCFGGNSKSKHSTHKVKNCSCYVECSGGRRRKELKFTLKFTKFLICSQLYQFISNLSWIISSSIVNYQCESKYICNINFRIHACSVSVLNIENLKNFSFKFSVKDYIKQN